MKESKDSKYPCTHMKEYANFNCEQHPNIFDCPDAIIIFVSKFDEYGIPVRDGGSSYIVIVFYPHCGVRLPNSKREKWFDELEKLGYDNPFEQDIPIDYLSDNWFRKE